MTKTGPAWSPDSSGPAHAADGHPDVEVARVRAAGRRIAGNVADAFKTDEELVADELLAMHVRRTEQAAEANAAKQLAAARGRGLQRGLAHAGQAAHHTPKQGRNSPSVKRQRNNLLTPLICQAQESCRDPLSTAEVWPKLQAMAAQRLGPFLGVSEEGLKYTDESDQVQFLTKRNLKDRLRR